jgi:hypothetical protein
MTMENEVLITAIFVSAGLLAYVIIPGLFVFRAEGEDEKPSGFAESSPTGTRFMKPTGFVVWDRVLDYMAGY